MEDELIVMPLVERWGGLNNLCWTWCSSSSSSSSDNNNNNDKWWWWSEGGKRVKSGLDHPNFDVIWIAIYTYPIQIIFGSSKSKPQKFGSPGSTCLSHNPVVILKFWFFLKSNLGPWDCVEDPNHLAKSKQCCFYTMNQENTKTIGLRLRSIPSTSIET